MNLREPASTALFCGRWILLTLPLAVTTGSLCAAFLWLLDLVTGLRESYPGLLYGLPVAGAAIAVVYGRTGRRVESGNNLILEQIHAPSDGVPLRMIPLVLGGTLLTHLCGGSAGREGTAVQMGGSVASGLTRWFPEMPADDRRILLMSGVAAGFGGVFGTPLAGTLFAMEVLSIGRMNYSAAFPCLAASIVSDQVCLRWGIRHTAFEIASMLPPNAAGAMAPVTLHLLGAACLCGVLCGLTSLLFSELVHGVQALFRRRIHQPVLRPVLGGCLVIGLALATGTDDYLGLGVQSADPQTVTITSSFREGGATPWSWFWKLVFTAVTVGSGFKGGEVTPLFFMGAALGNALAGPCGVSVDFLAGLGLAAVFAGATNTPLACTIMAIELFGGEYTIYFAIACFLAYLFSGHSGIYLSQQVGIHKTSQATTIAGISLGHLRQRSADPEIPTTLSPPEAGTDS